MPLTTALQRVMLSVRMPPPQPTSNAVTPSRGLLVLIKLSRMGSMSCNALNIVFEKEFQIDIGRDYTPVIGKSLKESMSYYLQKYELPTENIEPLKYRI